MNRTNLAAMLGLAFLTPAATNRDTASPAAVLVNDSSQADSVAAVLAGLRERIIGLAETALLKVPAASGAQFRPSTFSDLLRRNYLKIDDAVVRGMEESLDRVDSARTAAEWRRIVATDSVVRARRALQPRKPKVERRRKGGGDLYPLGLGEPKTPPVRDRTETSIPLPPPPKGMSRVGKMVTDFSYENWQLSLDTSGEAVTSKETPEGRGEISQRMVSKARMGVCPDPGGIVRGTFQFAPAIYDMVITGPPGTGSVAVAVRVTGTFTGRVNDAAELVDYDITTISKYTGETTVHEAGKEAVKQTVIREGGSASQTGRKWEASIGSDPIDNVQTAVDANPIIMPDSKPAIDAVFLTFLPDMVFALVVRPILGKALDLWRDGECLKLIVDPTGPLVLPSRAPVHIDVTLLEHRQTDERMDLPIAVTGSPGVAGLAPVTGKAPFGVDFRLPSREKSYFRYVGGGSVSFEALSRRGRVVESVSVDPDDVDPGYLITSRQLTRSEKEGISRDVTYRAVVRLLPQPDEDGNNYGGKGKYEVMAVQKKVNCLNDFPDDYERIRGMGTVKATASVSPGAGSYATVIFSLEPLDGPRAYLFTKSFRFMDKARQRESGTTDADQPLIATGTGGMIQLESDSMHQSRESEVGSSVCLGKVTETSVLDIVRLK